MTKKELCSPEWPVKIAGRTVAAAVAAAVAAPNNQIRPYFPDRYNIARGRP